MILFVFTLQTSKVTQLHVTVCNRLHFLTLDCVFVWPAPIATQPTTSFNTNFNIKMRRLT